MSLGVLNNLSAVYAENSLNNTNSSLNTVLQQLSSGSKINSGADDAAGLSLVDGLQANQTALMQSSTNATEGVGLLQVADGALSQVTSLLNRAVTLATEASNGTLDSTQDAAANQEYQSILSEINNIGSTTTFNQEQVFGSNTNIYTGDSSTAGSSIDDLSIRSLSSSNVGDSGGVMSYSNGQNNVFVNLSTTSANAAIGDTLNGSGTTTLNVNYLVQGSDGNSTTASTAITVGGSSGYSNTVGGMITAINESGLGLSANFTTQAQAGVQGGGTETGIEISGGMVSAGVAPSSSSTSGTLDLTGLAPGATLAQGAQVTVQQGSNSQVFTIGETNNTLGTLASEISGAGIGVNASVVTNGDGTQSLALADSSSSGGALSVSTTAGTAQAPIFAAGSLGATQAVQTQGADVVGTQAVTAENSTVTVGTGNGNELYSDQLTAGSSITVNNAIPNDPQSMTFVVGSGTDNAATNTYYTGNQDSGTGGDTLGNLADTINAQSAKLGVYATVTSNGLQLNTGTWTGGNYATSGASTAISATQTDLTGENVTASSSLSSATTGAELGLYSPTLGGQAGGGQPEIMAFSATNAGAAVATAATNILSGTFAVTGSQGSASFTMNGTTDNYNTLVSDINNAGLGVSASWSANLDGTGKGGIMLTSTDTTNVMSVTNSISDTTAGHNLTQNSVHVVDFGSGENATGDTLVGGAGAFAIQGSGGTYTSVAGDSTLGTLITDISASGKDLTATFDQSVNGGKGGILVVDSGVGAADALTAATMTDTQAGGGTPTVNAASGNGVQEVYGLSDGQAGVQATDVLSGAVQITGPHGVQTFTLNGTTDNYNTLIGEINTANLGVTAAFSASADGNGHGGITLTGSDTSDVIAATGTGFKDGSNTISGTVVTAGNNMTNVATPSTAILQLGGANIGDGASTLNGAITIDYHGASQTFIMGDQPSSGAVSNAIYTGGTTVESLVQAINSTQTGGQANALNSGGVSFQASAPGGGSGGIYLQGMAGYTGAITLTAINPASGHGVSTPLAVTSAMTAGQATSGRTGVTGVNASDSITTGGVTIATSDTMAGSITVTSGGENVGLDSGAKAGLPSVTDIYATGASEQDTLKSGTTFTFTTNAGAVFSYTAAAGDTWQTLANAINSSTTVGSGVSTGVTATWSATAGGAGKGGLVLTDNYNGATNVGAVGGTLEDQSLGNAGFSSTQTAGESVSAGTAGSATVTGFVAGAGDQETDHLTANSSATFAVDGQSYTFTASSAGTDNWQTLINDINSSSIGTADPYGVTASWSSNADGSGDAGMVLTNNWDGANPITYTQGGTALKDSTQNTTVAKTQIQAGGGTPTVSVLDAGAAAVESDSLTGTISMTVGANHYSYTAAPGDSWQTLVNDINNSAIGTADSSGVTATWNANAGGAGIGGIVMTDNEGGINPIAVTSNSLVDQASAVTDTFTAGSGTNTSNHFYTQPTNNGAPSYGNTLAGLAAAISAQSATLGVTAQANANGLTFTQTSANGGSIITSTNNLTDVTQGNYSKSLSTQLASENDALSGALVFNVGGAANQSVTMSQVTAAGNAGTVQGLISYINSNSSSLGVSASWSPSNQNSSFGSIQLESGTEGASGTVNVSSTLTSLADTTTGASLSYAATAAYSTGLSSSGSNKVFDSTDGQTSAAAASLAANAKSGSGIATISYSDGAGSNLGATDLSSQSDAETALTDLNSAIADVAAQDGYVGAQINTLNAVSSVLSTQQENVQSAQNAVQATDYATATSNMSKYEILSQTGIAALAQANSQQQEVLKLLQ